RATRTSVRGEDVFAMATSRREDLPRGLGVGGFPPSSSARMRGSTVGDVAVRQTPRVFPAHAEIDLSRAAIEAVSCVFPEHAGIDPHYSDPGKGPRARAHRPGLSSAGRFGLTFRRARVVSE